MIESEKISVIEKNATNKSKIKGSKFIGHASRITSSEDALEKLKSIRKEYYDATHHCYAYKTIGGIEKYSDDGEPNGTAGIRIFNAVNHYNLTDILVVVVRYYGGTKLGVGPLGKAYGDTAANLLADSDILELTKFEKILISYNFEEVSPINYLINKYKCKKITNIYTSSPSIECFIEPSQINNITLEIREKTSDNAKIELLNETFYLRLK
jgi:uncharacterized YigZ family protein